MEREKIVKPHWSKSKKGGRHTKLGNFFKLKKEQ